MPRIYEIEPKQFHSGCITTICCGKRSGKVFASGGIDKILYLWSIDEDEPILQFGPFNDTITCCEFDKSEELISFATSGGLICILDLENNRTICQWMLESTTITCIKLHQKLQKHVFVGDSQGRVSLFNSNHASPIQQVQAHGGVVNCIEISPQGSIIGTCGVDKTLKFFDMNTGENLGVIKTNIAAVTCMNFHPTDMIVASCATDRSIRLFDLSRSIEVNESYIIGKSEPTSIAFSADGECVIGCSPNGVSVFKISDSQSSDHFPFSLSSTYAISVFKSCIIIPSSHGTNIKYVIIDLDTFPLLKNVTKQEQRTNRLSRDHSIPTHFADQGSNKSAGNRQQKKRAKLLNDCNVNRKGSHPVKSDSTIYQEFSNDRTEYLNILKARLDRLNCIKECISEAGLSSALNALVNDKNYAFDLLNILSGKRDIIYLEICENLVKVVINNIAQNRSVALSYLYDVLSTMSTTLRATPSEVFTIAVKSRLHELYPIIKQISETNNEDKDLALRMLGEYQDLFCQDVTGK